MSLAERVIELNAEMARAKEVVMRTILKRELVPSVCDDSGEAEWSNIEADKLATAIVQDIVHWQLTREDR